MSVILIDSFDSRIYDLQKTKLIIYWIKSIRSGFMAYVINCKFNISIPHMILSMS